MKFKCRVWNGETFISPDYVDRNGVAWWKENSIPESSEELEQFTGLKDKNGEEIFEGDILRFPPDDKWDEENYMAYEVFYHDNDLCDRHVGFQMNRTHCYGNVAGGSINGRMIPKVTAKMEIISNIHETKQKEN